MKTGILKDVIDVVVEEDTMWIITGTLCSLFRYHFSRNELELETVLPKEFENSYAPFSKIIKVGEEIYLIPRRAKDVYCYRLTERSLQKLNISFDGFRDDKRMSAMTHGRYIYCINRFPDVVIQIDSATKKVNMFRDDTKRYVKESVESRIYGGYKEPCFYQGEIIWSNYNNTLTAFHTEKEYFHVIKLKTRSFGRTERLSASIGIAVDDWIVGLRAFENALWLWSYDGKVCRYQKGTERVENELLVDYVQYVDSDNLTFPVICDMVVCNKELWMIPSYKNKCIKYKNLEQYEEACKNYTENWKGYKRDYTVCKVWKRTNILLYDNYESCFYVLDTRNGFIHKMIIPVAYAKLAKENPEFKQVFERVSVKDGVCYVDDLEYLYERLSIGGKMGEEREKFSSDTVGKQIYQVTVS